MFRTNTSLPNNAPQDGQVARKLKDTVPGFACTAAEMFICKFMASPRPTYTGLETGAPVSLTIRALQSSSEKVVAKLNEASLLPVFCNRNGTIPYSPGPNDAACKPTVEETDTPYCSVTPTEAVTRPFSPAFWPVASVNQSCHVCC